MQPHCTMGRVDNIARQNIPPTHATDVWMIQILLLQMNCEDVERNHY